MFKKSLNTFAQQATIFGY